ncbi:MAG TPA: aminoacyl-tRNA hydrolase [Candidatus Paceibacterota bacterium]
MANKINLIIGLGNPGKKYEKTYHNAGFLFIECINKQTLCPKPHTLLASDAFMNDSGSFVAQALKKAGLKPEKLLVVHDDSDIEIGKFKLSFGRSSAGHKGVQSIIDALKTENFWRLRIGIRSLNEGKKRQKSEEFVLKKISSRDQKNLENAFKEAVLKIAELSA